MLSTLNKTSVKHSEAVVYKDVLDFLGNGFPFRMDCNCPTLSSTIAEEELLVKKT